MSESTVTIVPAARPPYRGYFALVLTAESKAALLSKFATLPQQVGHHMTVRFGTDNPADLPPAFTPEDMGRTFLLRVLGFKRRDDNGIEAVAVALLRDGRLVTEGITTNKVPHVTVALDPQLAKPVQSNALLESGFDPLPDGLDLIAVLKHVM